MRKYPYWYIKGVSTETFKISYNFQLVARSGIFRIEGILE